MSESVELPSFSIVFSRVGREVGDCSMRSIASIEDDRRFDAKTSQFKWLARKIPRTRRAYQIPLFSYLEILQNPELLVLRV